MDDVALLRAHSEQNSEEAIRVQRHAPSKTSSGYDWNAIATDASSVFTGPQLDALRTALELRNLSDQMTAVSTGHRRQ